jgi:hydrogenase small subunit
MMPGAKRPALLWLQSITCNGNTHSFLNHPDLFSILSHFDLIYHPVLETRYTLEEILQGQSRCDVLILEGSFRKSGLEKGGVEVLTAVETYAQKATHIITAGTCATFGGIFKQHDPAHISGFCFDEEERTERYETYASKLISLPGCPIHPKWLSYVLMMIANGREIPLDQMHRPQELYNITVHSGCSRNEYFEWKVDTKGFGLKEGCLFYELGCQGPYTRGSCNKILWNDISSKTVVGTPCFGCTEPSFPKTVLFETKTHMGIPATMPLGVPRRAYLTATGIAKSFKIKRFEERIIDYDR